MTSKNLTEHLKVNRYGDFTLTNAVRPSLDLQVVPREGYRLDIFKDQRNALEIPVLAASVSKEKLFDVFLSLLEPLGETVDVVLETSHDSTDGKHRDLLREQIDAPVLLSHFYDFEELLLHDGCTGVAVMSTTEPMEVQFDEHKLLVVYSRKMKRFRRVLHDFNVGLEPKMKLITEGEHLHSTEQEYRDAFEQLCFRLGVGAEAEPVSW